MKASLTIQKILTYTLSFVLLISLCQVPAGAMGIKSERTLEINGESNDVLPKDGLLWSLENSVNEQLNGQLNDSSNSVHNSHTNGQIDSLSLELPKAEWMWKKVTITNAAVKNWNTAQTGDNLTGSAESIIAEAGKQELKVADSTVVINKKLTETGLIKAEAVKEQLYAKAAIENKELNKSLDTVVKIEVNHAQKDWTEMTIRIEKDVEQLKEMDRLVIDVDSDISLEISNEQLQDNIAANDFEITIEEVKGDTGVLPYFLQDKRENQRVGFGGSGEKTKRYQIKMKKKQEGAQIGLSLRSPDNPYTAIFRKTATGEEVIGGKYDAKTRKLSVKIGQDGEYYVKKNEKNFVDIEGLPKAQKEMIKVLASKGVLKGNEKGFFNPKAGISRSELLTILVRLSYVYDEQAVSSFSDVKAGSWYYPYVSSGQKIGVVNGYWDNTFKPKDLVGAAEMAKMNTMILVHKKRYRFPQKNDPYLEKLAKNSNIPTWAVRYIAMAEREGFLLKTGNGVYDGAKTLTRGEAAEMLYRLWEKL